MNGIRIKDFSQVRYFERTCLPFSRVELILVYKIRIKINNESYNITIITLKFQNILKTLVIFLFLKLMIFLQLISVEIESFREIYFNWIHVLVYLVSKERNF